MSVGKNLEQEQLRRFVQYWDKLMKAVPEARREAVEEAGEAVKRALNAQIQRADLSSGEAKGRVKSWQGLRIGSRGGYAAISPESGTVYSWDKRANFGGRARQHTWKGRPVTARQVTTWLEQGHGTGAAGRMETSRLKDGRIRRRKARWGSGYAAGRKFYADTRDDALEIALKAADKVLCRIADEVDL